ncbi:NAD(P)H-binding protein [Allokutzneria sp. A3M-2-11 16]|uniref:NAD(P)H-binding protein n=1 Tax=Allokutzneria sp. A3M-2-11 16 TaxID=2962043 RepID=UPI0020B82007|nr:NAD(P)H-binding protein [Allokutzneria sp. A3M-2-11 16]MCP3802604.1 NAD(P)H-binding protein [Allokutzneria sp. A3M-2-11 16]
MTILVAGATGTVGAEVVRQLAAAGHPVRALSRNPDRYSVPLGTEFARGDLSRPETLVPALDGVTALHLITFGGDEPLTTGPEIVALAARAGVRRISVLSGWEESSVERALRAADIGWTWLQPVEFMGNALAWKESVRAGTIEVFGDWPSAMVHEADIAAVAVAALTEDGHAGQAYMLTGPEALRPGDRARILGAAIGKDLTVRQLSEQEERDRLRAYGYSEEDVEFGIALGKNPPEVGMVPQDTVERVTGRPARTFAQWAAEHADEFTTAT